jgi:hypothetical protein
MEANGRFHAVLTGRKNSGTHSCSALCEQKDCCPCQESKPDFSLVHPAAQPLYRLRYCGYFYSLKLHETLNVSSAYCLYHSEQTESLSERPSRFSTTQKIKGKLGQYKQTRTTIIMALHSIYRWALAAFQFLNPIHSRQDSLERGSASRKEATYLHRITHIDIYVCSGIRTHNPCFSAGEDNSCIRPHGWGRAMAQAISPWIPRVRDRVRSIRGWYNKPNSGPRTKWTQSHTNQIN